MPLDIENPRLGTERFHWMKIFYLFLFITAILSLMFLTTNVPKYENQAFKYWVLGATALLFTALAFALVVVWKKKPFPFPVIWEDSIFGKLSFRSNLILFGIVMTFALLLFANLGAHKSAQLVGSPKFQILELGKGGDLWLDCSASLMEDFLFFAFMPAFLFGIFYLLIGRYMPTLGIILVIVLLLNTVIFAIYHTLRYGETDPVGTQSMLVLAFLSTLYILIFRNFMLSIVHCSNNVAADLFANKVSETAPLISIFLVIIIWIVLGYIIFRDRTK